nr:FtsK/SpoIIIE domain-containing protein [Kibdelosporangium sp. MJ126-NF4]CEL15089.1 TraB protein [Kibdelosporangium sp. MJ126-NF4]CTQ93317.1 TraB protein [Kibdelosporangium sp. MJ126-NF4]
MTTDHTTSAPETGGSGELAEVHYLPTVPSDESQPAGAVVDAELITEAEYQLRTSQKAQAMARYEGYRRDITTVARVVRAVVTHPLAIRAYHATKRTAKTTWEGTKSGGRRAWSGMTHGHVREQIRRARTAGKPEEVAEWTDRLRALRKERREGLQALPRTIWSVVKAVMVALFVLSGILLVTGAWMQFSPGGADFMSMVDTVVSVVETMADVAGIVWIPALIGLGLTGLVAAYREGARRDSGGWLRADKDAGRDGGVLVTADGIVQALRHLNIPKLNQAFKEDWKPRFELTPTREGAGEFKGFRAIFDLPDGVTPDMVIDKVDVLAANLHRIAMEVWPSDYGKQKGGKARYVNLYVADAGIMNKPTPEYPLMHAGTADVFAGVPIGITQRGDVVLWPINASNFVFGGRPGQGKSNAMRVVFAGAALDPLAELRMHVFAGNGDFDSYERRFSRYHKGASPEHAELATTHLRELLAEVERREARLAELGAKKLTRAIAEQHPDMRPILVGFSECHELFGDPTCGEEAADLAVRVVKRGRKTGVSLGFDTQSSRANAIPSQLVENMGTNGCFSVKTWRNNDGFLGDGSFAAGIRATELRFNVDRGTMLATGVSEELFEILRTFYIEVNDDTGWDAAADIIERAMTQLAPGTVVSVELPLPQIQTSRNLLADLDEVLDTNPVPAGEVIGALRTLAPTWRPYKDLTVPKLVALLGGLGIKVPSTKNKFPLDPATVRDKLAGQAAADGDGDTDE